MKIANLTQHISTPEQKKAGVIDLNDRMNEIKILLTFDEIPSKNELVDRAIRLTKLCVEEGFEYAMIGGAPYFMPVLHSVLTEHGVKPLYAFSKRIVTEETQNDGSVKKVSKFIFEGFVEI